jgi:hypothetical protein
MRSISSSVEDSSIGIQWQKFHPQVDGLVVDTDFLRTLMGLREGLCRPLLEAACTDACISALKKWFESVADKFRECHLLSLLRRCTDMDDAKILDIFDLLDVDSNGCLQLPALHFLVCILAGRSEGRMKKFLYLRGRDSFVFVTAGAEFDRDKRPGKARAMRLFQFLSAFGFDQYVASKLHDLHLVSRPYLSESEVSLFLFAICQQHDDDYSALSLKSVSSQQLHRPHDKFRGRECHGLFRVLSQTAELMYI